MKRYFAFTILICFAALVVLACGGGAWRHTDDENFHVDVDGWAYSEGDVEAAKANVSSSGLLEEFPLASMKAYRDLHGEIKGSFFLGSGSISGSLKPENNYVFLWTIGGNTHIAELSADKIVFTLEEGLEQPTVRFKFQITSSNVHDKDDVLKSNPNVWIDEEHVFLAFVRISPDRVGDYFLIP